MKETLLQHSLITFPIIKRDQRPEALDLWKQLVSWLQSIILCTMKQVCFSELVAVVENVTEYSK